MEGKALLFEYLGGVDAVNLCLGLRMSVSLYGRLSFAEPLAQSIWKTSFNRAAFGCPTIAKNHEDPCLAR